MRRSIVIAAVVVALLSATPVIASYSGPPSEQNVCGTDGHRPDSESTQAPAGDGRLWVGQDGYVAVTGDGGTTPQRYAEVDASGSEAEVAVEYRAIPEAGVTQVRVSDGTACVGAASTPVVGANDGPGGGDPGAGYDWSEVDARLEQAVNRLGAPAPADDATCAASEACGLSVLLARADEDVLHARSFGTWSGGEIADIASASKWPSAIAIMTIVDDGLLTLDSTVGEWFPAHASSDKAPITLAQLLSHTSGLPSKHRCLNDQASTTLEACADAILAEALNNPPGTAFDYGGASMQVAGRMAELATGQTWAELFDERVAQPLGLGVFGYGDTANPRIAGGAFSDIADYDRFLRMHLNRGVLTAGDESTRVLSEAAIEAMETDRTVGAVIERSPKRDMVGYGLGIWIDRKDSEGRATFLSSPGAFGAHPWIDRARGYRGHIFFEGPLVVGYLNGVAIFDDVVPLVEKQLDGGA